MLHSLLVWQDFFPNHINAFSWSTTGPYCQVARSITWAYWDSCILGLFYLIFTICKSLSPGNALNTNRKSYSSTPWFKNTAFLPYPKEKFNFSSYCHFDKAKVWCWNHVSGKRWQIESEYNLFVNTSCFEIIYHTNISWKTKATYVQATYKMLLVHLINYPGANNYISIAQTF